MRKISIFCFLVLLTGSVLSDSEKRVAPLLALWKARAGHENMLWMEQRVKMGDKSHTGYIQGTGGGDDAVSLTGAHKNNLWWRPSRRLSRNNRSTRGSCDAY